MKRNLKKSILLLITVVFLYFVFKNIDIKHLLETIKDFDIKYMFYAAISILTSLSIRGLCFKILISKTVNPPLKDLMPLCITGSALNIVLPARAGDIFRAFYVGNKYNANKIKIFGAIMLERIFDGLTVLGILLFGIYFYNKNALAQKLCLFAAVIFVTSFIIAFIAIKYNKINSICSWVQTKTTMFPNKIKDIIYSIIQFINKTCNSFLSGFEVLKSPQKLLQIICTSSLIWILECFNYLIVIKGFNCDVHWSVTLFIIGFIALACMIPSTSIFIGPYQLAVISAFAIYGIEKETALAISFVEQSIVIISTSIVAILFLLKNNLSYKDVQEKVQNEIEEK